MSRSERIFTAAVVCAVVLYVAWRFSEGWR